MSKEEPTDAFCPDETKYEKLAKIGQGTFGEVFKARDKKGNVVVAIKEVLMENEKEEFPITVLREIEILQVLKNDNIVNLLEICRDKVTQHDRYKPTAYLVFEFCEHDLAGLLRNPEVSFNLAEVKKVVQQLLKGLNYIHSNKILHRNMKPANILVTKTGKLKLADFGLAIAFSDKQDEPRYTSRVVNLWYRPPELLLGETNYGPAIDLWGAGCIMAEMWTRYPIMQGNTEEHQLTLISLLCGSITPDIWPGVDKFDLFTKFELPKGQKRKVKERLHRYVKDQYALDLLDKLLALDPSCRVGSDDALNHDFFSEEPLPQDLNHMLSRHDESMFHYLVPPRWREPIEQQLGPIQQQQQGPIQQQQQGPIQQQQLGPIQQQQGPIQQQQQGPIQQQQGALVAGPAGGPGGQETSGLVRPAGHNPEQHL